MEKYKIEETVCSHPEWREDMFSRTCTVCGYNNLIEDYQTEKKGENVNELLSRINQRIHSQKQATA